MNLEFHITVECDDVKQFSVDCHDMGIKSILIETEKKSKFDYQVMTSSRSTELEEIHLLSAQLIERGYRVLRKKVEKQPETEKDPNFIYYETHFRLQLPKKFDRSVLILLCQKYNFHLSKNLFKSDIDIDYQMITYRSSRISLMEFNEVISNMINQLNELDIEFDKVEVEECIYDTNISIDRKWL